MYSYENTLCVTAPGFFFFKLIMYRTNIQPTCKSCFPTTEGFSGGLLSLALKQLTFTHVDVNAFKGAACHGLLVPCSENLNVFNIPISSAFVSVEKGRDVWESVAQDCWDFFLEEGFSNNS